MLGLISSRDLDNKLNTVRSLIQRLVLKVLSYTDVLSMLEDFNHSVTLQEKEIHSLNFNDAETKSNFDNFRLEMDQEKDNISSRFAAAASMSYDLSLLSTLIGGDIRGEDLVVVDDLRLGQLIFPSYDETIAPWIKKFGTWDEAICKYMIANLRSGASFLNIGSNVGYFAILGARIVGSNGSVYAFEPHPKIYKIAQLNYSLKILPSIKHFNIAGSDSTETLNLYVSSKNGGDHRVWADKEAADQSLLGPVRSMPIDNIVENIPIDLVLIDTQGFDFQVIKGLENTLKNCRPIIICEFMPSWISSLGKNPVDVINYYESLGYSVALLENQEIKSIEILSWMNINAQEEVNLLLSPDL